MSHHNGSPNPSPVKLEPTVKLDPIENGHAVTTTGNSLATRQMLRPKKYLPTGERNRAQKLKEYRQKIMSNYLNSSITWIIGSLIMAINTYYLMTDFINLLLHSHLEIVAKVFLGILGFSCMGVYLAGIAYLVLRKNRKATHLFGSNST